MFPYTNVLCSKWRSKWEAILHSPVHTDNPRQNLGTPALYLVPDQYWAIWMYMDFLEHLHKICMCNKLADQIQLLACSVITWVIHSVAIILCRDNNKYIFSNKDYSKELQMPHLAHGMHLSQENFWQLNFHLEKSRGKIERRTLCKSKYKDVEHT